MAILTNPMRRYDTLERQWAFKTPSKRDVKCPNFEGDFVQTGDADVVNDMYALCHDTSGAECDYKVPLGSMTLCNRYWHARNGSDVLKYSTPVDSSIIWQEYRVQVEYERPFMNRYAEVEAILSREVPVSIDLGNFLSEWTQWYESQPGGWVQLTGVGGRLEISNTINQSGRSFWYNDNHKDLDNYEYSYYVQARAGDDDVYGSVLRYDPTTGNFYSIEWDSGGWGINGLSLFKNVRTSSGYTKTRLAHSSVYFGANLHYIHKIVVKAVRNRITVTAYRQNGANLVQLARFDVTDDIATYLKKGAWGPLTESQPSTYFWDMTVKKREVLHSTVDHPAIKQIPLSYVGVSGGLHMVSPKLQTIFNETIQSILALNGANRDDCELEFQITGTNVIEGVQFSPYGLAPNLTTNMDSRIVMTSFPYDGLVPNFDDNKVIFDRTLTYTSTDLSTLDKTIKHIVVNANIERFFDCIRVRMNGKIIKYVPNILAGVTILTFPNKIQINPGDALTIEYDPNAFEIKVFDADWIDTHHKEFTIVGNILGWHATKEIRE